MSPVARFGKKRSTMWTGYKVHLTETCDEDQPHLITHVATTPAPKTDEAMTEVIQTELHQADLTPQQHLLDTGYVTSQVLVNSQKCFGIEVIGPPPVDVKWQANAKEGFDISQFFVDWEQKCVVCPASERRAPVGHLHSTVVVIKCSRSSSRSKIAALAPVGASVFIQRSQINDEPLPYVHKNNTRPYRRLGASNEHQILHDNMRGAWVSKPRSRRVSGPLACAARGILARQKPISSILGLLWLSIWFASLPGWMASRWLPRASLPMNGCITLRSGFTSSVYFAEDP
jgi:hypothetical protein